MGNRGLSDVQSCFDTSRFDTTSSIKVSIIKNFDHFKYSLRVKKENIWGEYSSSCKPSNVKILTT